MAHGSEVLNTRSALKAAAKASTEKDEQKAS